MKILILGGTQFVSWYLVKRLVEEGMKVTTLNRGSKKGIHGQKIEELYADRHDFEQLQNLLKDREFDYIIDVSAYTEEDIKFITESINRKKLKSYIFISSSAVYKESEVLPIKENFDTGENKFWGTYGLNKLQAEKLLINKMNNENFPVVILRPPYIYGEGNNVYREAFIFDRLKENGKILIPNEGKKLVQFLHIEDLFLIIKKIIELNLTNKIFNVGDKEGITFKGWIEKCMKVYGKETEIIEFYYKEKNYKDRDFFPFYDYQYFLEVDKISQIIEPSISLEEGLKRALKWYLSNEEKVDKRFIYKDKIQEILFEKYNKI